MLSPVILPEASRSLREGTRGLRPEPLASAATRADSLASWRSLISSEGVSPEGGSPGAVALRFSWANAGRGDEEGVEEVDGGDNDVDVPPLILRSFDFVASSAALSSPSSAAFPAFSFEPGPALPSVALKPDLPRPLRKTENNVRVCVCFLGLYRPR